MIKYLIIIAFLISSCTVLDFSTDVLYLETKHPSRIIYDKDTSDLSKKHDILYTRSSNGLKFTVIGNDNTKEYSIPSKTNFLMPLFRVQSIGFFPSFKGKPSQYYYPKYVFVDPTSDGNYSLFNPFPEKGNFYFNADISAVNHFVIDKYNIDNRYGLLGFGLGISYYFADYTYLNFKWNGSHSTRIFSSNTPTTLIANSDFSLSNNHKLNSIIFLGYGITYSRIFVEESDYLLNEILNTDKSYYWGLYFPIKFKIKNNFLVGLDYRALIYSVDESRLLNDYNHSINLTFTIQTSFKEYLDSFKFGTF